jgi:serine protease Do
VTRAEATEAVQPAGFAELIAKVKPAVISVSVKMDDFEGPANSGYFRRFTIPGLPDDFFEQFGFYTGRPGHRRVILPEKVPDSSFPPTASR